MLLKNGAITAYAAGSGGRESVSADTWAAAKLDLNVETNSATISGTGTKLSDLEVAQDELDAVIAELPSPGRRTFRSKQEAAKAARATLMKRMSDRPANRMTKEQARDWIKDMYPQLSDRAFDRVWSQSCQETGSGWDKGGRPKGG